MDNIIRVLVAKPGLDGHDRGALVIAQALRDAGMEVIYTGLRQTPQQIVNSAIQEDVDVIGLSILSGAHNQLFPEIMKLLKEQEADDIIVVAGGIIPETDIPNLLKLGISKIFTPGSSLQETIDFIKEAVKKKKERGKTIFKNIDHIGIAVKNIESSIELYTRILGLKLLDIERIESEKVKVAFIELGNSKIELLEATAEDSSIAKYLTKYGEGIHHIAIEVKNLEVKVRELKENNIRLINEEPFIGAHKKKVIFIHPSSANGVLIELTETL